MKESTTYQEILEKGLAQGLGQGQKKFLLRLGTKRFGTPPASIVTKLQGIEDQTRLDLLADRILDATSWDDLLAIA